MDRNQPWKWVQTKESGNPKVLGFSWPPRSYCCSFCGREFKSAQALGGHMNVHRRDRALLRNPCPSLNPNGNSSSSSSLSCFNPLLKFRSPSFLSSSCQTSLSSSSEVKNISAFPASSLHHSSSKEIDFSISKTSIDLNTVVSQKPNNLIGVQELKDSKDGGFLSLFPSKNQNEREFGKSEILSRFGVDSQRDSAVDDLDLELRLGCKSR